jgi:hypothetical protein
MLHDIPLWKEQLPEMILYYAIGCAIYQDVL